MFSPPSNNFVPQGNVDSYTTNDVWIPRDLKQGFLPSPPKSDTSSEQKHAGGVDCTVRNHTLPSYRFVSVAEALSERRRHASANPSPCCSVSGSSIPRGSSFPQEILSCCQRDQGSSSTPSIVSSSVQKRKYIKRAVRSNRNKPLLDLVWRDIGNGVRRAYPRQALPPLLPSNLSKGSRGPTEGYDYFIESDDDNNDGNTTLKTSYDSAAKTKTYHEDIELFFNDCTSHPTWTVSENRQATDIFSSDSEAEVDRTATISQPTSKYNFIPLPPGASIVKQLALSDSSSDLKNDKLKSDRSIATTHGYGVIEDDKHQYDPSNVQPIHLSPLSTYKHAQIGLSFPITETETGMKTSVESYNSNTSSGFSDTDTDTDNDKEGSRIQTMLRRPKYHRRRKRHETVDNKTADGSHLRFTSVAVLYAAERLVKMRAWVSLKGALT